MTGSSWRLLAVLSLILAAPAFLRGQDAHVDRSDLLAPSLGPLPDVQFTEPVQPPGLLAAPQRYPITPGTTISSQIIHAAGIIFLGRVTSVGHASSPSGQDAASTTVTFQVAQAMRRASAGQTLTIHEWAGLWARGERYRVGERVLLFLYPPSKLGFTSPVAGAAGKFAVDAQGRIVMNPQNLAIFAEDPLIGGRAVVPYADFARAVRRINGEK